MCGNEDENGNEKYIFLLGLYVFRRNFIRLQLEKTIKLKPDHSMNLEKIHMNWVVCFQEEHYSCSIHRKWRHGHITIILLHKVLSPSRTFYMVRILKPKKRKEKDIFWIEGAWVAVWYTCQHIQRTTDIVNVFLISIIVNFFKYKLFFSYTW